MRNSPLFICFFIYSIFAFPASYEPLDQQQDPYVFPVQDVAKNIVHSKVNDNYRCALYRLKTLPDAVKKLEAHVLELENTNFEFRKMETMKEKYLEIKSNIKEIAKQISTTKLRLGGENPANIYGTRKSYDLELLVKIIDSQVELDQIDGPIIKTCDLSEDSLVAAFCICLPFMGIGALLIGPFVALGAAGWEFYYDLELKKLKHTLKDDEQLILPEQVFNAAKEYVKTAEFQEKHTISQQYLESNLNLFQQQIEKLQERLRVAMSITSP